jgi:tRNA A37 methylthiotransferase MiaB
VRSGTSAEKLEGRIDKNITEERCAAITKLGKKTGKAFLEKQIGKEHTVLFEEQTKRDVIGGFTSNYLYAEAKTSGDISQGDMKSVKITDVNGDRLSCNLSPNSPQTQKIK